VPILERDKEAIPSPNNLAARHNNYKILVNEKVGLYNGRTASINMSFCSIFRHKNASLKIFTLNPLCFIPLPSSYRAKNGIKWKIILLSLNMNWHHCN